MKIKLLLFSLCFIGINGFLLTASANEGREYVEDTQASEADPFDPIEQNMEAVEIPTGLILPGKKGGSAWEENQAIRGYITNQLLPRVTNFILITVLSATTIMIILGGIMYIYSSGETEKASKGKDMIKWSLIGMAIAILAYTIIRIVTGIQLIG